jgi:hypothetical protein
MKKPIIAVLILVVLILLSAGIFFFFTGLKIEGIVIDSVEKKPVVSATIKINGKIDHTDKDGYFKAYMPIYPPVSIGIEKNGYKKFYQDLDNQWFFSSKKYEILLEPLTYQSILDSSRKELSSYTTYSFRYSWFFRIGEKDENHNYMIYQLGKEGLLRFKFLQDDRFGKLISHREIIRTPDAIFYQDSETKQWIKIREEEITISKMQDPFDILQIFQDKEDGDPELFVFDGENTLFDKNIGILYSKIELADLDLDEIKKTYQEIPVKVFSARWTKTSSSKTVLFYLNNQYQLIRADLTQEAPDETGKIVKQSLTIHISSINADVPIQIPTIQ